MAVDRVPVLLPRVAIRATPTTTATTPTTVTAGSGSPRTIAAMMLPIRGVAAIATPVRDAPIRCWLRPRKVQPTKKWITPAPANERNALGGASAISPRSWVDTTDNTRSPVATARTRNVPR